MKPNFLKTENLGKGLCKLLKEKAEKGVRGENGALMKKGLRPLISSKVNDCPRENGALMKKGLRRIELFVCAAFDSCENDALMKKG